MRKLYSVIRTWGRASGQLVQNYYGVPPLFTSLDEATRYCRSTAFGTSGERLLLDTGRRPVVVTLTWSEIPTTGGEKVTI